MNSKIPDKLFFKIGEVAELAGVEQHVLRYWEDEINALKPSKNKSGHRLYQKSDVALVLEIKRLLYEEKFTVAGAKNKLEKFKRKGTQMDFAYDREAFLEWKQGLKKELESILKSLEDPEKLHGHRQNPFGSPFF
jgi:DNA-binding transcriptional MerR regulator